MVIVTGDVIAIAGFVTMGVAMSEEEMRIINKIADEHFADAFPSCPLTDALSLVDSFSISYSPVSTSQQDYCDSMLDTLGQVGDYFALMHEGCLRILALHRAAA